MTVNFHLVVFKNRDKIKILERRGMYQQTLFKLSILNAEGWSFRLFYQVLEGLLHLDD